MSDLPQKLRVVGVAYAPGRVILLAEAPGGLRCEVAWSIPRHAVLRVVAELAAKVAEASPYPARRRLPQPVSDGG